MKYAFKTWAQAASNPEGQPSAWPSLTQQINDDQQETFEGFGWTVVTLEEYRAYLATHQADFDNWFNNRLSSENGVRLKVLDLVDQRFSDLPPSKVDFRRHLRQDLNLSKTVTMAKNGRPAKAEYFLDGDKIAEIVFEFESDAYNFMTRRRELLGYVSRDGVIREHWPIYDQKFDPRNESHARERIRERKLARQEIMDSMKSKVETFLAMTYMAQGKTYAEVLEISGNFWTLYASIISSWENSGTPKFRETIENDTETPFMEFEMPAAYLGTEAPMTIRAYIVDRVTY